MTQADDCKERLARMPADRKVLAYLAYAHQVTIEARECYDGSKPPRFNLRTCNEVLHRLTGHLFALQSGRTDAASEQSFAELVVATADAHGWLALLGRALTTAGG